LWLKSGGITQPVSYECLQLPAQITADAVWLYSRFNLNLRLIEDMLLERGTVLTTRRSLRGR
jgi:putative transposase